MRVLLAVLCLSSAPGCAPRAPAPVPTQVATRSDLGCFRLRWIPPVNASSDTVLPAMIRVAGGALPPAFTTNDVDRNFFASALLLDSTGSVVASGFWTDLLGNDVTAMFRGFDLAFSVAADSSFGRAWAHAWGLQDGVMRWGTVVARRRPCPTP